MRIPVFHGTRSSLAERIALDGVGHLSVTEQLHQIASRHTVAVELLEQHFATSGRFATTDDRAETISFAPTSDKAIGWANRAPEATWEALWSVYRLRHPQLGSYWNQSHEGHFWVTAQQLHDPPVVVTVLADLRHLALPRTGSTAWEMLIDALAESRTVQGFTELHLRLPEWRARIDADLEVVAVDQVPVRVDGPLACFMSDQAPEQSERQVADGAWGPSPTREMIGDLWFTFGQIWQRLLSKRRAELSHIAEVSIDDQLLSQSDRSTIS